MVAIEDASRIAELTRAVPGVVSLTGGRFSEYASFIPGAELGSPGQNVLGVKVNGDSVEIHIVAAMGTPLPELSSEIRRAVGHLAPVVDIVVEDVEILLRDDPPGSGTASGQPSADRATATPPFEATQMQANGDAR